MSADVVHLPAAFYLRNRGHATYLAAAPVGVSTMGSHTMPFISYFVYQITYSG